MSYAQLFPGCDVRWEDDRPFEISASPGVAADVATPARIETLIAERHGWRISIGPFYAEGAQAFADVHTCEPCGWRTPKKTRA